MTDPVTPPAALASFVADRERIDVRDAQQMLEAIAAWCPDLLRSWLLAIEAGRGLPAGMETWSRGKDDPPVYCSVESHGVVIDPRWFTPDDLLRIAAHLHQRGETT